MTGPIFGSYECCGASNANLGEHYAWCRNSPEKRAAVREEGDAVAQPDHYRLGGVEVIDAICAWGFGEGFNRGNAIKYIARAGRKDPAKTVEDLSKAARYLEMEIRRLLGEPMTQDAAPADAAGQRAKAKQAPFPGTAESPCATGFTAWPGKPDPMPYETRESYRCTPTGEQVVECSLPIPSIGDLGDAISLAVIGATDPTAVVIQCTDEQAAETIERLRKELANEKRRRVDAEKGKP